MITTKEDIASKLAASFSKISSSTNSTLAFHHVKDQQEKIILNFDSAKLEDYNTPFTLNELSASLQKSHGTPCGADLIHYQLLKHLREQSLLVLLKIFNHIWKTGTVPKLWKEALVIPLPKPGKDHTNP